MQQTVNKTNKSSWAPEIYEEIEQHKAVVQPASLTIIIIDKNVKSKSFYNASDLTYCVTTGNYLTTLNQFKENKPNKCNECDASFSKKNIRRKTH